IHFVGLFGVGEMRALQALLPHPQVAQIDGCVVARGAGAHDHHAAGVADEDRRRDGGLAGVLEHDVRGALLAQHLAAGEPEPFHIGGSDASIRASLLASATAVSLNLYLTVLRSSIPLAQRRRASLCPLRAASAEQAPTTRSLRK